MVHQTKRYKAHGPERVSHGLCKYGGVDLLRELATFFTRDLTRGKVTARWGST